MAFRIGCYIRTLKADHSDYIFISGLVCCCRNCKAYDATDDCSCSKRCPVNFCMDRSYFHFFNYCHWSWYSFNYFYLFYHCSRSACWLWMYVFCNRCRLTFWLWCFWTFLFGYWSWFMFWTFMLCNMPSSVVMFLPVADFLLWSWFCIRSCMVI